MKASARNQFVGKIKEVTKGVVTTKVVVDVNGVDVISVITLDAADDLDLKVGDEVTALVKATDVIVLK